MKKEASHKTESIRPLGRLFRDNSIERMARKFINAALSWGGCVTVIVDRNGDCSAAMTGTLALDRVVKADPAALVGTYHLGVYDRTKAYTASQELISGDIWHHWQQIGQREAA